MFIINEQSHFGGLSGPQFRWLFERLEEDADAPEVIALCRELKDHAFDFGSVDSWSAVSLGRLAATVERFKARLQSHGAELLRPGADVGAWVRIVEELAKLIRSDPRLWE